MLAFPGMLVKPALNANMKTPKDPNNYNAMDYSHFHVFCNMQLGKRMGYPSEHWDNAKVIADIPESEIMKITLSDLIERGFSF